MVPPPREFSCSNFSPNLPKGKGGRHNEAKRKANEVLCGDASLSKACRGNFRAFHRRFGAQMEKYNAKSRGASGLAGKYCLNSTSPPTGADMKGKSTFLLDNVGVKVPPSRELVNKGALVVGEDSDGQELFLCLRVPARRSQELSKYHCRWRKKLRKIMGLKPNCRRGAARQGSSKRLVFFGWRKNPQDTEIGEYAFKQGTSEKDARDANCFIGEMAERLERVAHKFVSPADLAHMDSLKKTCGIPGISGDCICTQFSIGLDYWSPMHDDDDFFWCVLSTLTLDEAKPDEIIHWFVFPDYDIAVPLCSGDIIIFNPLVLHGCTNPRMHGSLIFSAYVSAKTVATCIANNVTDTY